MTQATTATLSSKRQITIPAHMARKLQLEPGARLILRIEGERIVVLPVPENLAENLAGSLEGCYGDVDQYLSDERAPWLS